MKHHFLRYSLCVCLFFGTTLLDAGNITMKDYQLADMGQTGTDGAEYSQLLGSYSTDRCSQIFVGTMGEIGSDATYGTVSVGTEISGDYSDWADDTYMLRMRTAPLEDDMYSVGLYIKTSEGTFYGDYVKLKPGAGWSDAYIDLSEVDGLSSVEEMGFVIKGDYYDGTNSILNPSNPDFYKIEAAPIPEPATLTLFGVGALGAAALRRRKKKSVEV